MRWNELKCDNHWSWVRVYAWLCFCTLACLNWNLCDTLACSITKTTTTAAVCVCSRVCIVNAKHFSTLLKLSIHTHNTHARTHTLGLNMIPSNTMMRTLCASQRKLWPYSLTITYRVCALCAHYTPSTVRCVRFVGILFSIWFSFRFFWLRRTFLPFFFIFFVGLPIFNSGCLRCSSFSDYFGRLFYTCSFPFQLLTNIAFILVSRFALSLYLSLPIFYSCSFLAS